MVCRKSEGAPEGFDSGVIYSWDEAVLYCLLLRRGLLNLSDKNRHKTFFKALIHAARTTESKKLLEEYANSDSEIPPDITSIIKSHEPLESEGEIQIASARDLSFLPNEDPLDYGQTESVEQVLAHTDILESINVDEEAIQFYLHYSIDELWKQAFTSRIAESETALKVRLADKNGNKYHDTVVEKFLSDYDGCRGIKLPAGYSFHMEPTLMQLYVAYKIKNLPYFGNFSATGAGKTLSAILASRVIDSKMTVIICPNDVVDQWKRSILEVFPEAYLLS
jgi:hypothetical protein